jgi:hypothetical protein
MGQGTSTNDNSTAQSPRLEVVIYQIADDALFAKNRIDGTGWDWKWADWRRDWMDETPSKYAYRCLPLTIANQTGWWILNPVGFTAIWNGRREPGSIQFLFDGAPALWADWINNQFGEGVITWNTLSLSNQAARISSPGDGPSQFFQARHPANDCDH